ncbi:serine hydrolase domain-containing protein [Robertkochia solimangrovi]|uniref:serine hydrolase domain-containing protein n=1 Tax=Robertkochia solimangrovi TaxID=2213046 RepID=UPI0013A54F10|nr:serine hydrolase domain-containing protein [Robertkochia solimangrovi]
MKNIICTAILLFLSCKSETREIVASESKELKELQSKLDALFNDQIDPDEPGAALLVAYDGEMLIGKGYGLRDVSANQPITKSTNLRMGSISKQFTALSILQLVDAGKINLNDSVYSFFPVESFKDGTTLEELLNHTSGKQDAEEAFFTEWDSTKVAENKDILAWYQHQNRTITPHGEEFQYNNGIYELIPCIVEKVSGQKFAEYAKTYVFDKAGMEGTNFFDLAHPIDIQERAYCYEEDAQGNWKKVDGHFLNGLLGAGGVYTSVNDYFRYDQALRNGMLLSDATAELIFKPSSQFTMNDKEMHYAMGWMVTDSTAMHTGGWFGTNTFTKRYLNKPLTIAIFMNRNTLFDDDLVEKTDSLVLAYIKLLEEK